MTQSIAFPQHVSLSLKKLCFALLFSLLACMGMTQAYNPYSTYLGGDSTFILCDGHMGTAWYVDRSSLVVGKYEPPQYIISVNVVTVPRADQGNTAISKVHTLRFFYNSDLGQMYVDRDGTENWRYLPPNGSWAETGISMPAGEIAFALAYNMKFYGVYDNSFYDRI